MTKTQTSDRRRAADDLIAHFERSILDGTLAVGDTLPPEREIVQAHGVSRTVVREAVLALSNRGLVRTRPGFRPVVIEPGYDTVFDLVRSLMTQLLGQPSGVHNLFELRSLMETQLVRVAAQSAQKDDIRDLKDALAANKAAIADSERFYQTDMAFHGVLYQIPRNPVLPSVHRAYTDWLAPQFSRMPRNPARNQMNYAFHAKIFDAILLRDPDRAETELRTHLASAWEDVSKTFEEI